MGSLSAINLNSLFGGSSSSGINVAAAVAQALSAESGPLLQYQQEQVTLQGQNAAITTIEGEVSSLATALNALGDPAGGLTSLATTSSNSSIVSATATPGAATGNHIVVVNNLATTGAAFSDPVASATTQLPPGSFQLQVGSGSPATITVGSGVNTLNDLASSINGLGLGVTASVVNDSTGSRLAIVSNSSGAANDFTISNATGINFTRAAIGTDASLTVDGIPIDSASNTVSGAVNGVTFNLQSAAPGVEVNVSVAPDHDKVSGAINDFVKAYNAAISDVNSQFKVDGNNNEGVVAGDTVIRVLQNALLSAASYSSGAGSITGLSSLGIKTNDDGTLTVDSATLNNAIANNFSAVQTFFQGANANGFAASFNNQLDTFTDAASGAFTVDLQSLANENNDLQNHIDQLQAFLNDQRTLLTAKFSKAEILLQQLPTEQAQLNAEFGIKGNG